jgi:hypothetical protein
MFIDQFILLLLTILIFNAFTIRLGNFISIVNRITIPVLSLVFYLINHPEIKHPGVVIGVGSTYWLASFLNSKRNILDEKKTFISYLFFLFYVLPDESLETSFLKITILYLVDFMMARNYGYFNLIKILITIIVTMASLVISSSDLRNIIQFCFIILLILDTLFEFNDKTDMKLCFSRGIKLIIGYMFLMNYWDLVDWTTMGESTKFLHLLSWLLMLSLLKLNESKSIRILIASLVLVFINQVIMMDKSFLWIVVICLSYLIAYVDRYLSFWPYHLIIVLLIMFASTGILPGHFNQVITFLGIIFMALICLATPNFTKNKII